MEYLTGPDPSFLCRFKFPFQFILSFRISCIWPAILAFVDTLIKVFILTPKHIRVYQHNLSLIKLLSISPIILVAGQLLFHRNINIVKNFVAIDSYGQIESGTTMGVTQSCLRYLRHLLGNGDDASNSDVNEMHPLYQLPPELFSMIINKLDLHDEFALSQTSRGLRDVFRRHWERELSQLPSNDRSRFWAGLAFTFPDHWACPQCNRMHPIDESDTPYSPQNPPCGADLSLRMINPGGYSLQQNHIQSALKLSRMGNSHRNYLYSLMRPHMHIRTTEFMFEPSFTETYTAWPRIINGRFILRREWVITDECHIMRPLFDHITIPGCPHLNVFGKGIMHSKWWKRIGAAMAQQGNPRLRENIILEQAIENAMIYEGCGIICSCPRCPTDYVVKVSRDMRTATIRAWHDFGGEGAPEDTGWDAHVKTPGLLDWVYEELRFGHVPGSIEKLWVYTPE